MASGKGAPNIFYIIGVESWCSGLGLQVRLGVRQDPHRSPDGRASARVLRSSPTVFSQDDTIVEGMKWPRTARSRGSYRVAMASSRRRVGSLMSRRFTAYRQIGGRP